MKWPYFGSLYHESLAEEKAREETVSRNLPGEQSFPVPFPWHSCQQSPWPPPCSECQICPWNKQAQLNPCYWHCTPGDLHPSVFHWTWKGCKLRHVLRPFKNNGFLHKLVSQLCSAIVVSLPLVRPLAAWWGCPWSQQVPINGKRGALALPTVTTLHLKIECKLQT